MATQTVVSQEIESEFLGVVDEIKEFYLNNPTSDLNTCIFLTREGGIKQVESVSEDGNVIYTQAEGEFGSPVWLIAILSKDAGFNGMWLLPDLAEALQLREYYFTSHRDETGQEWESDVSFETDKEGTLTIHNEPEPTCKVCGRPWVDGKCSGGFVNHEAG